MTPLLKRMKGRNIAPYSPNTLLSCSARKYLKSSTVSQGVVGKEYNWEAVTAQRKRSIYMKTGGRWAEPVADELHHSSSTDIHWPDQSEYSQNYHDHQEACTQQVFHLYTVAAVEFILLMLFSQGSS